jgi:hypothetical protein
MPPMDKVQALRARVARQREEIAALKEYFSCYYSLLFSAIMVVAESSRL